MGDGWMDGRTDGRVMDGPKWSVLYKMFRHTPLRVSFQHLRKHFSLCLLYVSRTCGSSCQISPCGPSAQPLHNNALLHYLVVLDSGFASEQCLLESHSTAHGPTLSQFSVIPSTTPVCAQCFQVVGQEVICRHSFPGAPVPGDLGWNSGSCVSWHSMARLQPCTEVVSCTALSALCSAFSGPGASPA